MPREAFGCLIMRTPGDLVFIFLGALPIALALCLGYFELWANREVART